LLKPFAVLHGHRLVEAIVAAQLVALFLVAAQATADIDHVSLKLVEHEERQKAHDKKNEDQLQQLLGDETHFRPPGAWSWASLSGCCGSSTPGSGR
jgi:hypothetical protein